MVARFSVPCSGFLCVARSLLVASSLRFFRVARLIALALCTQSIWTSLIAAYAGQLLEAFRESGVLCTTSEDPPPQDSPARVAELPGHGPIWRCNKCDTRFDTFETGGICPQCSARFEKTTCLDCRHQAPVAEWRVGYVSGVGVMKAKAPHDNSEVTPKTKGPVSRAFAFRCSFQSRSASPGTRPCGGCPRRCSAG